MTAPEITINCFFCDQILNLPNGIVGRSESCPKCHSDVKVCYNCKFYDFDSYNECRESMAERVTQKDKGNFCDYFAVGTNNRKLESSKKSDNKKKLEDLFKK